MGRTKSKVETESLPNVMISAASAETVARYGAGVRERLVAYSGIDNELGKRLHTSLKDVSNYKISADPLKDPKRYYAELKAKAGYSAEVLEVAERRAAEAQAGRKPTTQRVDDLPGHVNDPLYDITDKVDASGNPVPGSSAQLKFRGKTPEDCLKILSGKSCEKYVESNCKLVVPKDYYDGVKEALAKRIEKVEAQIAKLEAGENAKALETRQAELEKLKRIDRNLRQGKVTNAEAQQAVTKPGWVTAKGILRDAHQAGKAQAGMGAAIGGGVSIITNLTAVFRGEKKIEDAAVDVAKDTAIAGGMSYATAFTGAVIGGTARNASSAMIRSLAKSNLPSYIVTTVWEIGKTMTRYVRGEIDGAQCIEELGVKGYSMSTSAVYAAIGQAICPIPVVGALAGSMFGYYLGNVTYAVLRDGLVGAKLAREERIRIERECEAAIAFTRKCRAEIEADMRRYFQAEERFFRFSFGYIKACLDNGDIDGYIAGTNAVIEHLGGTPAYANKEEFNNLMSHPEIPFVL